MLGSQDDTCPKILNTTILSGKIFRFKSQFRASRDNSTHKQSVLSSKTLHVCVAPSDPEEVSVHQVPLL